MPATGKPRNPPPRPHPAHGRDSLPRAHVSAEQHQRLLSAMTATIAEHGYARSTIAEIIARAGVSRKVFHEHFADKRECFLAAYDAIVANYIGVPRSRF
jgi:AcrR family transcriptional regulator